MNSNNKVTKLLYQMLRRQIDFAPFCAWQNARRSPPGKEKRREKKRGKKENAVSRINTTPGFFPFYLTYRAYFKPEGPEGRGKKFARCTRGQAFLARRFIIGMRPFSLFSLFFFRENYDREYQRETEEKKRREEERKGEGKKGAEGEHRNLSRTYRNISIG